MPNNEFRGCGQTTSLSLWIRARCNLNEFFDGRMWDEIKRYVQLSDKWNFHAYRLMWYECIESRKFYLYTSNRKYERIKKMSKRDSPFCGLTPQRAGVILQHTPEIHWRPWNGNEWESKFEPELGKCIRPETELTNFSYLKTKSLLSFGQRDFVCKRLIAVGFNNHS